MGDEGLTRILSLGGRVQGRGCRGACACARTHRERKMKLRGVISLRNACDKQAVDGSSGGVDGRDSGTLAAPARAGGGEDCPVRWSYRLEATGEPKVGPSERAKSESLEALRMGISS